MPSSPHHYCETCGALLPVQHCAICQSHLFPDNIATVETFIPHTLFRDRYDILGIVGEGGFGSVYKARDMLLHRFVAIKEIRLRGLSAQAAAEASTAFHREVQLLSQLTHPGLPRFYEHFQQGECCWYIVMEFIDGQTLEEYLSRGPQLYIPLSEILFIGVQLCMVLEYLHAQRPSIIFRDLKPANIMRTPVGQIYVIDFGIARHFKPGQPRDTIALGSPGYAAPEQYGKAQTTPQADIYSLGVVLYQLLTRKDPCDTPFTLPPLQVNSNLSICDLAALVNQMIALDVSQRPKHITQVRLELERIARVWQAINLSYWLQGPQHHRPH
jgi:serine/threonine protein kinase